VVVTRSEARTRRAEYLDHLGTAQIADHKHSDHAVELLPRIIPKISGIAALEGHRARCTARGRLFCTTDHLAGDIDAEYRLSAWSAF
jgi:hypothetical protein